MPLVAISKSCQNGHLKNPENTYINKTTGQHSCRRCNADRKHRYYRLKNPEVKRVVTYGELIHGTANAYGNRGCRCTPCKDAGRDRNLKNFYGISLKIYNEILEQQGGVCAICGTNSDQSTRRFHLDHNHITGRVRGVLCGYCNTAIGFLREDKDTVAKALKYLKKEGI